MDGRFGPWRAYVRLSDAGARDWKRLLPRRDLGFGRLASFSPNSGAPDAADLASFALRGQARIIEGETLLHGGAHDLNCSPGSAPGEWQAA